jgi:hypothetical protein
MIPMRPTTPTAIANAGRHSQAFGGKWENQWAPAMLWYTYYNFCRIHKSLRVTPRWKPGNRSPVEH